MMMNIKVVQFAKKNMKKAKRLFSYFAFISIIVIVSKSHFSIIKSAQSVGDLLN